MSKRDIDDYVEFLYHKDRETCATCPQKRILGVNDCRRSGVTRLYPIPIDMLLVGKRFRQDVLVAYSLVQQMVPEVIGTTRVQPSTFRSRGERCCKPGAVKQPNPPPKGFNEFSRDLIERSLYPSSPVCWVLRGQRCEREIISHQIVVKQATVGGIEAETEHQGESPKTFRICDQSGGSIYCGH
ncbi:hypothetical protein TWF102_005461 [Orbilia oligospora]|uniref:Uncharacterized protein n=1 Tax=Orbilia oligospora TaxID=2813651 RepID=A0A7C8NPW2_ORBOL|nr:hypothetical protein TWF103_011277 [Orbilia oligospora]KAF3099485.1 hypothetical protein TWF102_005461 [Orbilia oligospora]KAF3129833.1 hypothetical protein TWF703_008571 [Orbilia oligospora]